MFVLQILDVNSISNNLKLCQGSPWVLLPSSILQQDIILSMNVIDILNN